MKISVVTPLFAIGGVPLAQIRFARALADAGHTVDIVTGRIDPTFSLPEINNVSVIDFEKSNVRGMLLPLVKYFRSRRPDIVFSAEDHLNVVALAAAIISRSKAKVSGSSRVTPFDTYSSVPFTKGWFLKLSMRAVMHRADALTCVSKDMVEQYGQVFSSPPHVYAYNIADDKHSQKRREEAVDDPWFSDDRTEPVVIAAGHLAEWKGFTDLIQAMKVLGETRTARLVILGDGPMKGELQALIEKLDLTSSVRLLGFVDNPLKYFSRADVFVLSSYVEGLPNVLVEAMMCGCTPVSTDCPTGPREVLQDEKYGYLVPVHNPEAMAAGIEKALQFPKPQELLREGIAPFTEQEVLRRHFEILGLSPVCAVGA